MQPLYLQDCYLKEFEATVKSVKDGKFVVLDNTAFYPNSGGQPYDTGTMVRQSDGKTFKVVFVGKFGGEISHEVENPEGTALKPGDKVQCSIDWGRRYKFMRYHTAAHILSGVIQKETEAKITGNQIGLDKSRIDFDLEAYDPEKLKAYVERANGIVQKALSVKKYFLPREEALKKPELFTLRDVLPPAVKELRIVEIEGFDISACGGTHLDNTKEVGTITFVGAENKGKGRRRVYFSLE